MLGKPLLSESWRDIIAIASAVVTVVGFVLTVSHWFTRSANHEDAICGECGEGSRAPSPGGKPAELPALRPRECIKTPGRSENFVDGEIWDKAMLRLSDLAEQASQLADADRAWKTFATDLRIWEETMKNISRKGSRFDSKKWGQFLLRLQDKIDSSHGPSRISTRRLRDDPSR
jgi:hypothetical protein